MTAPSPTDARKVAVFLLDQVLEEGRLMSDPVCKRMLEALTPADRARAQRLAYQTMRSLPRADLLLKNHLRKTPPLEVHNILRLATVELSLGGDAHGIVNEAVTLCGANRRISTMKGMVNAVLRKVAADVATAGPGAWDKMKVPRLPRWLREPLQDAYGAHAMQRMEAAHFAGAPLDLTAKTDPEAVAAATGGQLLPTGSVRLSDAGQVSTLPGFEAGEWWVQDAAAALPARILNVQPGERVLDMCAAPGGKTLQMSAAGADVTALDLSETRLSRVIENLTRTGLRAQVVAGDALTHQGQYDAILLDAPCSATGTIRRHPDLPLAKDGSEFGELMALQAQMLEHALTLLAPGGRLVFCTCSLLPDEGECHIEEALIRHPNLQVDRDSLNLPGIEPEWITEEGGLRLRPDFWHKQGGMDGFYIACLRV